MDELNRHPDRSRESSDAVEANGDREGGESLLTDEVHEVLTNSRRRHVVSLLLDRDGPTSTRDLAERVAAREANGGSRSADGIDRERVFSTLRHVHLPRLADAGLVEYDPEEGTVRLADTAEGASAWLASLVGDDGRPTDCGVETDLETLASLRRRTVLSVLEAMNGRVSSYDLAVRVAAMEQGTPVDEVTAREHDDVLVSLECDHLPALDEAGLVEYDPGRGSVAPGASPSALPDWPPLPRASDGSVVDRQPTGAGGVRTLGSWEAVIGRCLELFEAAEDELFVLFTANELLEEGCLRGLQAAAERGVEVYAGAASASGRKVIRERVPDAVVWEPNLDWLDTSADRDGVGRVVLADREAVLLSTVGGKAPDGVPTERALTATDADDPLVALVRGLVGPSLDEIGPWSGDAAPSFPL